MGVTMRPAEVAALIGTGGSAVLATLRRDGRAVPVPIWYVAFDDALWMRTPAAARKVANIARDARVSVLIHDGYEWSALRGVVLQSVARVVRDDVTCERVRSAFGTQFADRRADSARLPQAMSRHYANDVILCIPVPDQILSWDNRKVRYSA